MAFDPSENEPDDGSKKIPQMTKGGLLAVNAVVLYTLMILAGVIGSWLILDRMPLSAAEVQEVALWKKVAFGAGLGLAVFIVDQVLERFVAKFKAMSQAFIELLGKMTTSQALILAFTSSVGEEIFFRGFLQSWLGLTAASILFGLMHIAPDRRLWFWPVMAIAMGFGFGWLFEYTGDVLAPIIAHFTINYFGLMALSAKTGLQEDPGGD